MKRVPPLFEPGWLERISADPALASREITWRALEGERLHEKNRIEFLKLQTQRDELQKDAERRENAHQAMQLELYNERRASRSSKAKCADMKLQLEHCRQLSDVEARKARLTEQALEDEKARNNSLERRIRRLEQTAMVRANHVDDTKLVATLKKLIRKSPTAGKKLAFVLHPDKNSEFPGEATELFRFVQNLREG